MNGDRLYVDASVIAGLVLGDGDIDAILGAVPDDATLTFSEFGFGEVVSAIAARVRSTRASDDDAARQVEALRLYLAGWDRTRWLSDDLDRAISLTARASLALKLPDAIHLATAERLGLPLLTTDRQQCRAARAIGLRTIFPLLPRPVR